MSNPNIVYLANDSPKASISTTTAEPITTITSTKSTAKVFSSEIQIPALVIPAYSNQQETLLPECQNNFSCENPSVAASSLGYYGLAPNAVDVQPLIFESNYISGGYCEFGCNRWEYLPPPPGVEVPILPSIPPIIDMARPPQSSISMDTSETNKQYNQEVDKFLKRIKLNDNVASKTIAKRILSCDCKRYKKTKTSVKHVPIKTSIKTAKDSPKLAPMKTKAVSQTRKHIDKIKKQIDLIENEIQRRKTELSMKEQQIREEINIIQQKQPTVIACNDVTNELSLNNEQEILNHQAFTAERTTAELKRKPHIKSAVHIARNIDVNHPNKYKINSLVRNKPSIDKYNNVPYPLKVKSFAKSNKFNPNHSDNNNMFHRPQIKTESIENKVKENIVISLNLQQELHSTNKQFTISQHESTDKNEKEIHLTIRISDTDNPTQIKSTKSEEIDGSVIDLSFLDEIDVDEIVECLNVADEPMETDVITSECHNSPNLKYENSSNISIMPDAADDCKNDNTEKLLVDDNENALLSTSIHSELEIEKVHEAAQVTDYDNNITVKEDIVYDEFMEICNIVNDPKFSESSQKSSPTNGKSNTDSEIPWAIDCLADSYDPVIIKSCTIETETFNNISELNEEVAFEHSEAHHTNYVTEDLKDYSSESAVSITSYSNSIEYDYSCKNEILESSDTLREDIESDNIEQRAKNLLLSIFNNPELLAKTQPKPRHDSTPSNEIDNREHVLNIDDEMSVCSPDSNIDNFNKYKNYDGTETSVLECNNNIIELLQKNNVTKTKTPKLFDDIQTDHKIQPNARKATIPLKVALTLVTNTDVKTTDSNKTATKDVLTENSDKVNKYLITDEAIGDQNNMSSQKTKDNVKNTDNVHFDIKDKIHISDGIVPGKDSRNITKIESKDMDVDIEEHENLNDNTTTAYARDNYTKEGIQSEMQDNIVSKIEISETQIAKPKTDIVEETDNDILIITPEPNLVDLTKDSENKTTRKKITFNESTKPVQEANITEKLGTNDNENVILPEILPLKSPHDFVLALKLEQGISLYFNSEHEITGIIKRGTFSDIYRVKNKNTGEVVAAKVIRNRKNIKETGIQKAEWMKRMQEGIPNDKYNALYLLHGIVVDGMWCTVLEYYPQNLEQVLMDRGRGFPIEILRKLARQLVSAVLLLRSHKIIHSDIKPHHILVNATTDRLKLGGFDESFQRVHAKSLSCIGTVHYRAPELVLGYFVGHGIDVWATALVLYEMMTNIKLFPANTNNEVLYQQLCTVGPVPNRMLANSKYRQCHYRGDNFFRDGMDPAYKRKPRIVYRFFESERIITSIFGAYTKHWSRLRSDHREEDYATLNQFCKLLKQMLVMEPYCRIGIESVYADGFIYEL